MKQRSHVDTAVGPSLRSTHHSKSRNSKDKSDTDDVDFSTLDWWSKYYTSIAKQEEVTSNTHTVYSILGQLFDTKCMILCVDDNEL